MVDLTVLFPIAWACVIIFFFTRFPKTGIVISVLLCLFCRDAAAVMSPRDAGYMILIMAELRMVGLIGIVACVIQRRINKLSEKPKEIK